MEVKVGILHVQRELTLETEEAASAIQQRLTEALANGGVLHLTDDKGLKQEGRADQQSSAVKQTIDDAADKAKDFAQSAKDKLTGN